MQKKMMILLTGLFLVTTLFVCSASAGPKEDTMALVSKGQEFIKQNGVEKAVAEFNTPGYQKGDLYLFVYDYKGDCLAHGSDRARVGKNLWNVKTPTGKFVVREQIEAAKKGGGWTEYEWMHETKKVLMTKETYVMPIQGKEAYVACGFYKE